MHSLTDSPGQHPILYFDIYDVAQDSRVVSETLPTGEGDTVTFDGSCLSNRGCQFPSSVIAVSNDKIVSLSPISRSIQPTTAEIEKYLQRIP